MRKLTVVLAAGLALLGAPSGALGETAPPAGGPPGASPPGAAAQGPGRRHGPGAGPGLEQRDHGRARLALTLGLAEALDLDDAQALKLRDAVDKFTQKRQPLRLQQHEAMQVLRTAATADKPDGAAVEQALAKLQEARAQALAADQALFAAVTKDMNAQKKARAALFLGRFHGRMGRHDGPGGPGGPGMQGRHGPRGMGGMRGQNGPPGPGPGDALSMADDDLDDEL